MVHWFASSQKRSDVDIDIILSPKQAKSFRDRIAVDGTDAHAIDGALSGIKSENATASVQVDLEAIRALIQKYSGGFGTLNDTVKQYLRRWFVSQGGVKVVARRRHDQSPRAIRRNQVAPARDLDIVASTDRPPPPAEGQQLLPRNHLAAASRPVSAAAMKALGGPQPSGIGRPNGVRGKRS